MTAKHPGRVKENWDLYDQYGYYPFDRIKGESVSRTMECAYDDWCAGVMAEKLGHGEDAAFFSKRSAVDFSHRKNAATVPRSRLIRSASVCVDVRWMIRFRPLSTMRPIIPM